MLIFPILLPKISSSNSLNSQKYATSMKMKYFNVNKLP